MDDDAAFKEFCEREQVAAYSECLALDHIIPFKAKTPDEVAAKKTEQRRRFELERNRS